jgi:response regulator RpfG family c-di-GMP phosphodiesterase
MTVKASLHGTILVVDDDPLVLRTLLTMLEEAGHTGIGVPGAAEAVQRLQSRAFDLVITDLHLGPDRGTGLDLIDFCVQHDDTVPIVLITAYPSIRSAVDAIKRGAVDFLPKPFDRDQLLHLISRGLQERRLRQENRRLQAEINKASVIEKLNRELNGRLDELTRLYAIADGFNQFLDTAALFERIVHLAARVTGARRVSVMMLDRARSHLKIRAALGLSPEIIDHTRTALGEGIAGQVASTGHVIRMTQSRVETVPGAAARGERRYLSTSWLSVPLTIGHEVFGVVNLTDKPDCSDFSREEEQLVLQLVEKAGIKLENQALYEGIYSNLVDTLNSLVTTIEAKDPYTGEHSRRVTDYAILLARHLRLDDEQIEMLGFAGILHDIGKIGVRDEILTKSGPLTPDEYEMIKRHPVIGERIVEPLGLVREEQAIIRSHHEHWDGRGYPDAIAGERIPLLARILSVADAFDAMTTTRSYRSARSTEDALAEMQRCAGTQFDPGLVPSLKELVDAGTIAATRPAVNLALEAQA